MIKLINKIEDKIVQIEEWYIFILLLTMIFMAFVQVILRNFFSTGFIWSDIFIRMGVLFIALIGASIATSDKAHIKIDLFNRIIPSPYSIYIDYFVRVIAFLSCLFFLNGSMKFVLIIKESGKILNILHLPEWWFSLIFPISFTLISLKYLFSLLRIILVKVDE